MPSPCPIDETIAPDLGRTAERPSLRVVGTSRPATDRSSPPIRPAGSARTVRCRACGEPIVVEWASVVSSHHSSSGGVAYVRCACGGLGLALGTSDLTA